MQRSDWGSFGASLEELVGAEAPSTNTTMLGSTSTYLAKRTSGSMGSFMNSALAGSGDVKSLRERLGVGKLSTMMKELEALRPAPSNASKSGEPAAQPGSHAGYSFSFGGLYA